MDLRDRRREPLSRLSTRHDLARLASHSENAAASARTVTKCLAEEAVTTYATRAAEKLSRQGLACGRLAVFVMTDEHRPCDPQHAAERTYNLPMATYDAGKLNPAALTVLDRLWRPGFSYKKVGVTPVNLSPAATVQAACSIGLTIPVGGAHAGARRS